VVVVVVVHSGSSSGIGSSSSIGSGTASGSMCVYSVYLCTTSVSDWHLHCMLTVAWCSSA